MAFEPAPDPSIAPDNTTGTNPAVAERMRRLREASAQGCADAQFEIGCLFHAGEFVARDDAEAACWWGLAALGGHARAQCELGCLHVLGRGVARNLEVARLWLESAAAQSDTLAQYELGMLELEPGGGGTESAARWFARAGAQDHPCAQYRLGLAYRDGAGVVRDDECAMYWLDAASTRGCALAAYALAELGWRGRRVPPRRVHHGEHCQSPCGSFECRPRN
ncbi:Sel1 repeat protein [mine drainage metagenome]|jgi:TPR repeat protein|uniref:Sel1 repeat protein n=1 Tax=mine drainage metagenome TaxID=410659 RepID=A0A1J5QT70_9ZZZZ